MSSKTNKSYTKRLKITRTGKILGRKPGFNHFNAKQSRTKQLAGRKMTTIKLTPKNMADFLPHN
jgi:ribosomal protein L35